MGNEFPYGDIIVLAAVALFVVLRLRATLGKKTGFDVTQLPKKPAEAEGERIIQLSERSLKPREDKKETLALAEIKNPGVTAGIGAIRAADPTFDPNDFLRGARGAFDMVFDAFAKGDRKTLQNLLSTEVYQGFDEAIRNREASDVKQETTLVSVKPEEITEAKLNGSMAEISVRFLTEQISIARSADGKIASGNPSQVDEDTVEWTFERDIKSRNPNWKITAT